MQAAEPLVLSALPDLLNHIPLVEFDQYSRFKYIYISMYIRKKNFDAKKDSLFLIRGTQKYSFHADIFASFKEDLRKKKFSLKIGEEIKDLMKTVKIEVIGGGWFEWTLEGEGQNAKKKLIISGESVAFGRMDHQKTKTMILKHTDLQEDDIIIDNK